MKERRVEGTVRAFDMQTLSTAQRWLMGGNGYFSFKPEPIEGTEKEGQRIAFVGTRIRCSGL